MNIQAIIGLLENSKNDNDKFALLLILSELIKANKLDELKLDANSSEDEQEKCKLLNERLFNSIGSNFLARLLTTRQATENCSPIFYKSTSLSIICGFLDYPSLVCDSVLLSKMEVIFDILKLNNITTDSEENAENLKLEKNLLLDVFKYLFALAKYCPDHLISMGIFGILMNDVILKQRYEKFKKPSNENISEEDLSLIACKFFCSLCTKDKKNINKEFIRFKSEQIEKCLKSFITAVDKSQNQFKFNQLPYLNILLEDKSISEHLLFEEETNSTSPEYSKHLFNILNDLFMNKINKETKKIAFVFLNNFIKLYQFEYIYMKNRKFFYLLIHLLCIEIGINIEAVQSTEKINIDSDFLENMSIYYLLIEEVIVILSTASPFDTNSSDNEATSNDEDDEEEYDAYEAKNKNTDTDSENYEPELKKVIKIIVEILETIILFVKDCLIADKDVTSIYSNLDKNCSIFLVSCIRLLNCWLSHESLLEKEILELFPRLIEFCDHFNKCDYNKEFNINVFEFLIPSLERVLADEKDLYKTKFSNAKSSSKSAKTISNCAGVIDADEIRYEFERAELQQQIDQVTSMLNKCKTNIN